MLKQVIILNGQEPEHFPSLFDKEAAARGLATRHLRSRDCIISVGFETGAPVAVIAGNEALPTDETGYLFKRTGQDTYRLYLIGLALQGKAAIFSDEANLLSDKSADKITMMVSLPLIGVNVPRSIITTPESYQANREYIRRHISFPAVIKKTGSKGKKVWKVADETELEKYLNQDEEAALIQEYVPNDHDFRVFVLDGEVIAAIKRSSADGFYNNVSQGGAAEKAEMTAEEKEICLRAASAAKLRLAGVDLVRTPAGPLIFEVNKAPQLDIFSPAAGFDIEKLYSERVLEELARASK